MQEEERRAKFKKAMEDYAKQDVEDYMDAWSPVTANGRDTRIPLPPR